MWAKGKLLGGMRIGYDPAKSAANIADEARGFGFELSENFDFDSALIQIDDRRDYGEVRFAGLGMIGSRVHAIVFTLRPQTVWVISLRKANDRERRRYEQHAGERAGAGDHPSFPRTQ
jgi:uncharacterized DUF497 family protein